MPQGQLIVSMGTDTLDIWGVAGLDADLRPLVGTGETKEATVLTQAQADKQLEPALVNHIRGGKNVMEGYVKFAKQVRITGTARGLEALRELFKISKPDESVQMTKTASGQPLFELVNPAQEYFDILSTGDIEKAASHPFNNALFKAIEEEGHDARDLGFPVRCKIKFANKSAEQLFVNAAKIERGEKAAFTRGVDALVKSGGVKSSIADLADIAEADPRGALTKVAAHYIIAVKQGDMEKAAGLGAILARILPMLGKFGGKLLGLGGKALTYAGKGAKGLGLGAGVTGAIGRGAGGLIGAGRAASRTGAGTLARGVGGAALGLGGLAALRARGSGQSPDELIDPSQMSGAFGGVPPAQGFGPGAYGGVS